VLVRAIFGFPANIKDDRMKSALGQYRSALYTVVFFALFTNLLSFAGVIYLMQVYDRVLPSRNLTTLAMLTIVVLFLVLIDEILTKIRHAILGRGAYAFEQSLANPVFSSVNTIAVRKTGVMNVQPLRDLVTVRDAICSNAVQALCDIPYVPLFMIALLLLHPLLLALGLAFMVIFILITIFGALWMRDPVKSTKRLTVDSGNYSGSVLRNFEVLRAMGMLGTFRARWNEINDASIVAAERAQSRSSVVQAVSGFFSHTVRTITLCVAAILVIDNMISVGALFATMVILQRGIMPVQRLSTSWRSIINGRTALANVDEALATAGQEPKYLALPRPEGEIEVEQLSVAPPGSNRAIVRNVHFSVAAGRTLGIVGPSGSGKSTLARAMIGIWQPLSGAVRIDGAELTHWDPDVLGRHVGYIPQDVALFQGTVAQNIARFQEDALDSDIVDTAIRAGVHDLIQSLPDGYNTMIGEGGGTLSGGQRQRIGLARAMFGEPSIVVLDEPNSNLDAAGEEALMQAIRALKARGTTVVIVTHKANVLQIADDVLVMSSGVMQGFGRREDVMQRLVPSPKVVSIDRARNGQDDQRRLGHGAAAE
jgi:ATP-binding cassette, subfamily C, bacterial